MNQYSEKTEYRAKKTGYMDYILQFLVHEQIGFWWWKRIAPIWSNIPNKDAKLVDFVTHKNAHNVSLTGYGIRLKANHAEDFNWFIKQYPNIQKYFDELNEARIDWLERKLKDAEKPGIINFDNA